MSSRAAEDGNRDGSRGRSPHQFAVSHHRCVKVHVNCYKMRWRPLSKPVGSRDFPVPCGFAAGYRIAGCLNLEVYPPCPRIFRGFRGRRRERGENVTICPPAGHRWPIPTAGMARRKMDGKMRPKRVSDCLCQRFERDSLALVFVSVVSFDDMTCSMGWGIFPSCKSPPFGKRPCRAWLLVTAKAGFQPVGWGYA